MTSHTPLELSHLSLVDLLTPDWFAKSLFEVTPERLRAIGIEGVMLDMDNTLTEYHSETIPPAVLEWMGLIHAAGLKTCVVSNTHRPGRLKRRCDQLGVDYILGVRKPRRRGLRLALSRMGTPAERTAIIGDQIFTDMLGGNRMGLYTILVEPLSRKEFLATRLISRTLERVLFSFLNRTRRFPPELPDHLRSDELDQAQGGP